MVPGITSVSASELADVSRVVVTPPPSRPAEPEVTAAPEPPEKYQPVRVGPLFSLSKIDEVSTAAKTEQRVEADQFSQRAAADNTADNRALQQKLYSQF